MEAGLNALGQNAFEYLMGARSRAREQSTAHKAAQKRKFTETETRECRVGNMSALQRAGHTSLRAVPAKSAFSKASLGIDDIASMAFKAMYVKAHDLQNSVSTVPYVPGTRRNPSNVLMPNTSTGTVPMNCYLLNTRFTNPSLIWYGPNPTTQTWLGSAASWASTMSTIKNERMTAGEKFAQDRQFLKWMKIKMLFCGVKKVPAKYRVIIWRVKEAEGDFYNENPIMQRMFIEDYRRGAQHPVSVTRNLADESFERTTVGMEVLADRHITVEPEDTVISYDAADPAADENRANHVEEIFIPVYKEIDYRTDAQVVADQDAESITQFFDRRQYDRTGLEALTHGYSGQAYPSVEQERIYMIVYSYVNQGVAEGFETQGFDMSIERAWLLKRTSFIAATEDLDAPAV